MFWKLAQTRAYLIANSPENLGSYISSIILTPLSQVITSVWPNSLVDKIR